MPADPTRNHGVPPAGYTEGNWEEMSAADQDVLRLIAEAESGGYEPTIRSYCERHSVPHVWGRNDFAHLSREDLIVPDPYGQLTTDPLDSHWKLTPRGERCWAQGDEAVIRAAPMAAG